MNETPSTPPPGRGTETPNITDEIRLLRRSQTDRVIAGVLGGVGRRLGVDPTILRIATAVLALFGGVGILLYALAWLLLPADGEQASVVEQAIGRREVRDASAVPLALALGAAVVISSGVILGGSWNGTVLLILAAAGLYTLLRRRTTSDSEAASADAYAPGHTPTGYTPPGYNDAPAGGASWAHWPPPAPETDTTPTAAPRATDSADANATVSDSISASDPTHAANSAEAAANSEPASPGDPASASGFTGVPYSADSAAQPMYQAGAGWPEGPDWQSTATGTSPYDDLYLRPEADPYPQPDPQPPGKDRPRSLLGPLTFCSALISVGVLATVEALAGFQPGPLYVAAPLAVVAFGLLVGTWFGRSRGLITLGILLTLVLIPATFVSRWDLSSGPSNIPPPSVGEDVPAEPLTHGIGPMDYDMSMLELTDDDAVTVTMRLGMGPMNVIVPETADVVLSGSVGAGVINAFGQTTNGLDRDLHVTDTGPDGPGGGQIELNLDLGMGPINVIRADTEDGQ